MNYVGAFNTKDYNLNCGTTGCDPSERHELVRQWPGPDPAIGHVDPAQRVRPDLCDFRPGRRPGRRDRGRHLGGRRRSRARDLGPDAGRLRPRRRRPGAADSPWRPRGPLQGGQNGTFTSGLSLPRDFAKAVGGGAGKAPALADAGVRDGPVLVTIVGLLPRAGRVEQPLLLRVQAKAGERGGLGACRISHRRGHVRPG